MDLGLGNLIELKRQVLAPALQAQTAYDLLIQAHWNWRCEALRQAGESKVCKGRE
jgi:hypothetical protein